MTATLNIDALLATAENGISAYLKGAFDSGAINEGQYDSALESTMPNLRHWLTSSTLETLSPNLKPGLADAIEAGEFEKLVNAYRQPLRFGTGGIRGMMGFDKASILKLQSDGLDARILKGPGTINNIVFLNVSAGVAAFGKGGGRDFQKIVIGFDSRVRGGDFARIIAELFLAFGYTVYLFDEPCPYPMVTYAIPSELIKSQLGLLISASHNDYRYNGYKLSCGNGSQFDPKERNEMYEEYIVPATFEDIKLLSFTDAPKDKLWWLGGSAPVPGVEYYGREDQIINIHKAHADHVRSFLFRKDLSGMKDPLKLGYCAYHGAGRKAMPRMLREMGIEEDNIKVIHENGLNDLNGMFPSFPSDPGQERQPDPGDPRAAAIAIAAFKEEYGETTFKEMDFILGTDPDADRTGIAIHVPPAQRELFGGDWTLLPADEMWALLVWFRLKMEADRNGGKVPDANKKFAVYSHTSCDAVGLLCLKYGLGYAKSWVGFANISACIRDAWDGTLNTRIVEGRKNPGDELCHPYLCQAYDMDSGDRTYNIGAMEQSNGFSLLGLPPKDGFSLGEQGHVRDKDGTFAGILATEVAAWAKEHGKSLLDLIDTHIYLDPDVGLFVNWYEPDPLDGEYPGIEGDRKKMAILNKALGFYRESKTGKQLTIGGLKVSSSVMYRTGKYDRLYPPYGDFVFPDEGVRFYFGEDGLSNATIRPSGTGNSLRFHVQLHSPVDSGNLIAKKKELRQTAEAICDEIREILDAPR